MSSDAPDLAPSRPPRLLADAAAQYAASVPTGAETQRGFHDLAHHSHGRSRALSQPGLRQQQHPTFSTPRPECQGQEAAGQVPGHVESRPLTPPDACSIVRLFQCRRCSHPYQHPVALPCGRSICKACLPQPYARTSITYPALPSRVQALQCPFPECGREHVLDDCGVDVALNKAISAVNDEMERAKAEAVQLKLSTLMTASDAWEVASVESLSISDHDPCVKPGSRLVAVWALAVDGGLHVGADVTYHEFPSPLSSEERTEHDIKARNRMREALRSEMDCQVCYSLLSDPVTTGCGHTFCRTCLRRVLDHSPHCPVCRRKLAISPLLSPISCPSNESITAIIEAFWTDEVATRRETERAAQPQDLDLPLFICTLSFPTMPTFLHIFEPRYRLMIRRALEGDRTFGMVLPKRPLHSGDTHFRELGTLLRIVTAEFYPDGRSLIETVGLSRFRVLRHGQLDGYTVGKTERVDDVSLDEEEAMEAAELGYGVGACTTGESSRDDHDDVGSDGDGGSGGGPSEPPTPARRRREPAPRIASDLDSMTTRSLMRFARAFVARMRERSAPWLTESMAEVYGECPDDPAVFPWWFASILPLKDYEKYRLLATSSVRGRLKICSSWIMEMDALRWPRAECVIF